MICKKIDMSVDYKAMGYEAPETLPCLKTYIIENPGAEGALWKKRPAIIICPGGAYAYRSDREAEPIALKYAGAGFHAFVMEYSTAPIGWPAAASELAKAIAYVRSIADEYDIDKEKIIVCGFSAGGHLAASSGVHYDNEAVKKFANVDGIQNKPDGMILCYPVITGEKNLTHMITYENFVEGRAESEEFFGLENYVTPNTPKAFIWHTFGDMGVPVENSVKFASAMIKNKVACEFHIYPKGDHGLSLANEQVAVCEDRIFPEIQGWIDMSIVWVKNL